MSSTMATTPWAQARQESLAAMTETERAEYDAAAIEAEARLQLAELVYHEGYSRGVWGCFPSAIGRWPAPAGYHGYKTNTPMNPEGTGHHHGLYHGIDR